MKKIHLVQFDHKDKSSIFLKQKAYSIHLGNGITVRFSDKRSMDAYMAEVNSDLNFNLVVLNQVYIDVHTHFRKIWFYLNNGSNGESNERHIIELFRSVDKAFDMMVTRSHFPSGNHHTFKNMMYSMECFDEIVKALQSVEMAKNGYVEYRMLKVILTRIEMVRTDLTTMGMGRGNVHLVETHKMLG